MSHDPMKFCQTCGDPIASSEDQTWLWELHRDNQDGPHHPRCADDLVDDDPTRWFRTEEDKMYAEERWQDGYREWASHRHNGLES